MVYRRVGVGYFTILSLFLCLAVRSVYSAEIKIEREKVVSNCTLCVLRKETGIGLNDRIAYCERKNGESTCACVDNKRIQENVGREPTVSCVHMLFGHTLIPAITNYSIFLPLYCYMLYIIISLYVEKLRALKIETEGLTSCLWSHK